MIASVRGGVRVEHIHRNVLRTGNRDLAGLAAFCQFEVDGGGQVGVAVVLVGDQVAEAVVEKAGAAVRQLAQLHRLRHMNVSAEHERCAVFKEKIRKLALLVGGGSRVFLPPVHIDGNRVRVGLLCAVKVAFQQVIVDFAAIRHVIGRENVYAVRMLVLRQAVRAVGIGEKGEPDTTDVHERHGVALLLRAVGAHMVESGFIEHIERAREPRIPRIQTVVARGREQVKTDRFEVACQLVGGAELRKTRVGRAVERGFDAGGRVIGAFVVRAYLIEQAGKVVPVARAAGIDDGNVHDKVARNAQRRDGIGRRFGGVRRGGRRVALRGRGRGFRAAQAMPCEKAARAGERQHDDERNQPLYLLHSGLCGRDALRDASNESACTWNTSATESEASW